jgi:hypothetical protein
MVLCEAFAQEAHTIINLDILGPGEMVVRARGKQVPKLGSTRGVLARACSDQ